MKQRAYNTIHDKMTRTLLDMSRMSFDTLGLKEDLLKGIFAHGFQEPATIQTQAIPILISGTDAIVQAQSGSGKTATFAISALQRIDTDKSNTQVLILSPTRELAQQSYEVIKSIGQRMEVKAHCFTGGLSGGMIYDSTALERGVQIAVGTPGRILALIREKKMNCSALRMLILDEADEMLSRGFQQDISEIFKSITKETQIVLVSATMPQEIRELAKDMMNSPKEILVKEDELTLDGIRQYYTELEDGWKVETLLDIFKVITTSQSVVFLNTIPRVKDLYEKLQEQKFACACIHSEMDQSERNSVMDQFRKGDYRILLATNIVARGIDVQNVSLVINYDIPKQAEAYLHRIGRSGRFGRKGFAINFVVDKDKDLLKAIQEKFSTKIDPLPKDLTQLV